jgi:hypothetical protein
MPLVLRMLLLRMLPSWEGKALSMPCLFHMFIIEVERVRGCCYEGMLK